VIGAHYDHLADGELLGRAADRGRIHPGADDNASGLAVMLELARTLRGKALPRSLIFIAFTGEENGRLGSRYYVAHAKTYPADNIIAMLNLDSVGRLGDKPLILFGTGSADEWVHIFRGAGYVTGVPLQPVADDFGSSDQTSFIEAGIPAVQFFSGNHADMHRPGDTPDKIDSVGLIKVAKVLQEAVQYLAERKEPLRSTLNGGDGSTGIVPAARRTSFGTVPDFTWSGDGVRLDDVRSGTPAALAGLRKGDIISAVNDTPVRDMRDYGQALRVLNPGDTITVRFQRDGTEQTITTRVTER
jgi:Iap family predicted aminopeptidase